MKVLTYIMTVMMLMSGCKGTVVPGTNISLDDATQIELLDTGIKVNGAEISEDKTAPVYRANDIVYYPEGKDFTFGEGEKGDEHTEDEANAHTVVHIAKSGVYEVSGELSKGQIAVDLGEDAKDDPEAIVTLVLNNADITCEVAPAVIFYNVYECGEKDGESATMDVNTTSAGANVIISDGSTNNIKGSYVARIYKSIELSEDGTKVVDSKKLHKYDGAFYSKMSMNIYGGKKGDGILNINADNEGLDTELHLTLNGGIVNIKSGNDGINTNEDNISVCTINGGELNIVITGKTGEGDGIDSNGWLIINGGTVRASACGKSMDSGIDADKGVYINGGTVMASGNMLDHIEGTQGYSVFNFSGMQKGSTTSYSTYFIKSADGNEVVSYNPVNDFSNLVFSSDKLTEGEYSLWRNDEQQLGVAKQEGGMGMFGGRPPMGERPNGDFKPPEGMPPDFQKDGKIPAKEHFDRMNNERLKLEYKDTFKIEKGANFFMVSDE